MSRISDVFQFEQTGPRCVVRVNPESIGDYSRVEQCRDELAKALGKAQCTNVTFNIEGIPFLPSGVIGLLISLRKMGVEVEFSNASSHVREVMRATKLDELVRVHSASTL